MGSLERESLLSHEVEHRAPAGADLVFHPCFLAPAVAERYFTMFAGDGCVRWRQDHIQLYGRRIALPRLTAWYGEAGLRYSYSGIVMEALSWDGPLRELATRVEEAAATKFNSVLLNLYRDGRDGVSWHSDDEPELGPDPAIGSLSLGAARSFELRRKDYRRSGVPVEEFLLGSGSLLLMRGTTQRLWQHRLPKRIERTCGPRVNLSFRWIAPGRM